MSLRPRTGVLARVGRAGQRMAPGGRRWSESPVPGPGMRRPRQVGPTYSVTYTDYWYAIPISQTLNGGTDGDGDDTWGGAANGQDFAVDSTTDEEAICRTQLSHDTYGGSPWTASDAGPVHNTADGYYFEFDPKPADENINLGIQLSWALDPDYNNLQQYYEEWIRDDYLAYGFSQPLPTNFQDSWIDGYRLELSVKGGEGHPWFIQFVTGMADPRDHSYTESDSGLVVREKYYVPYQGTEWSFGGSGFASVTLDLPAGTQGMPLGSWGTGWRMRIGMDEQVLVGDQITTPQIVSIDKAVVYVDFTVRGN